MDDYPNLEVIFVFQMYSQLLYVKLFYSDTDMPDDP